MDSFREAYGVLQRHAQTLRNQDEPNIDDLLTIVTESVNAYKVCKQRIDAVEAALKTALDGAGVNEAPDPVPTTPAAAKARTGARAASIPGPATPPAQPAAPGFEDMDDDIPF
ncbi:MULTISPECIES: exodeoxyribonuclease VII small subunit [unclassified Acidovorax]|uniref:exodeoxyribonuclease VII small subunit n=1 Tax=unclassified Acidovorax TaxID=2684926 RepID=UPI0021069903|nr:MULTISPECIES: exodeoxyribonuclease VII small subunit [unclassified Acidovorax]